MGRALAASAPVEGAWAWVVRFADARSLLPVVALPFTTEEVVLAFPLLHGVAEGR